MVYIFPSKSFPNSARGPRYSQAALKSLDSYAIFPFCFFMETAGRDLFFLEFVPRALSSG